MMATVSCRSCGRSPLLPVLSLGRLPLANALLTADDLNKPEPVFPLELARCPECTLLQLTESVPPEQLFSTYLYFSSFSDAMVRHAGDIAERLIRERALGESTLVVEVASNDGYLLQHYRRAGVPVLGIEPAANIAVVARERGVPTRAEFFGAQLAQSLAAEGQRASVVHANNVLAHVPDLNGFVQGFKTLLAPDGVAVVEAPYAKDMLDNCEFDTIYHEHLCYFSLTALDRLFSRNGLSIYDVERLAIHGGSLRIFAAPAGQITRRDSVSRLLQEEASWVTDAACYDGFAGRVEGLRQSLVALLHELKGSGKRLVGYGAAAKGATLINYCGIGTGLLDFVVDRNPHKQGRFMPGMHVPVCGPDKLLSDSPDYVLLLTWNFAAEIFEQQAEYRGRGGRFIVPVPDVRVV